VECKGDGSGGVFAMILLGRLLALRAADVTSDVGCNVGMVLMFDDDGMRSCVSLCAADVKSDIGSSSPLLQRVSFSLI
jgi:hypothetical protein